MRMERLDDTTIKVILTTNDMEELELSYRDMDYNKPETKKAMTQIVSKINSELNINLNAQKLFIEAYPYADGGCILFVNLVNGTIPHKPKPAAFNKYLEMPVVYKVKTIDAVGNLSKRLLSQGFTGETALYFCKHKSEYYLAINEATKLSTPVTLVLNEYGYFLGKGIVALAILNEHNTKLIEANAIEVISQCT